jgi:hypothetical protein
MQVFVISESPENLYNVLIDVFLQQYFSVFPASV